MKKQLYGKRVAILVTDGVEQSELVSPKEALEKAGAQTDIIAPSGEKVRAWDEEDWGGTYRVNVQLKRANPDDYDALLLPGGVISCDKLRRDHRAVEFVHSFFQESKPIGAICHGLWILIEAGVVPGRRMTSWPSLQTDLKNAGADWVDEPVVTDDGLVTSRKPADIPLFNHRIIETFSGSHLLRAAPTAAREQQSEHAAQPQLDTEHLARQSPAEKSFTE